MDNDNISPELLADIEEAFPNVVIPPNFLLEAYEIIHNFITQFGLIELHNSHCSCVAIKDVVHYEIEKLVSECKEWLIERNIKFFAMTYYSLIYKTYRQVVFLQGEND